MSARARARLAKDERVQALVDSARRAEEVRRRAEAGEEEVVRFEGECDVCGEPISLDWLPADDGSSVFTLEGGALIAVTVGLDYGIDAAGRVYSWVRHYATAPPDADPRCAIISSVVWRVGNPPRSTARYTLSSPVDRASSIQTRVAQRERQRYALEVGGSYPPPGTHGDSEAPAGQQVDRGVGQGPRVARVPLPSPVGPAHPWHRLGPVAQLALVRRRARPP